MADLSGMFERLMGLETHKERVDVELAVIRGPLPLEHKQPVDSGALGDVVVAVNGVRRMVRSAAVAIGLAILGGAGGTLVAIRTHWVDQGRAVEKKEAELRYLRQVERRLRALESHLAGHASPVVSPLDEEPSDYRNLLPDFGGQRGVRDDGHPH